MTNYGGLCMGRSCWVTYSCVSISYMLIILSKGWKGCGIFKPNWPNCSLKYPDICFLLLYDERYCGVKEVRKIVVVRNFYEFCHINTLCNCGHSCYCWLCLSHDHAFVLGKSIRSHSCSLLCSSGECLQRSTKVWLLKKNINFLAMSLSWKL